MFMFCSSRYYISKNNELHGRFESGSTTKARAVFHGSILKTRCIHTSFFLCLLSINFHEINFCSFCVILLTKKSNEQLSSHTSSVKLAS